MVHLLSQTSWNKKSEGTEGYLPLCLTERSGIPRVQEPVTVGVPFPKGVVFGPASLALYDPRDVRIPLQVGVLKQWSDGSVQWALLDFQASVAAREETLYRVQWDAPGAAEPSHRITVEQSCASLVVHTGYATFFLNPTIFKPFDRILVQGINVLDTNGSHLLLTDAQGRTYTPSIQHMSVETAGALRATLKLEGTFGAKGEAELARFICRLSFYAGSGFVEAKYTLHNPRAAQHTGGLWDLGDHGSIYFRDLTMRLALHASHPPRLEWSLTPDQPLLPSPEDRLEIYQESSGGDNWSSTNHVNRFGQTMQTLRGYRVRHGDRAGDEGDRATPILAVCDQTKRLVVAIDKFWQNFPKALDGQKNQLTVGFFPGQYSDIYELQGGEQKTHTLFLQVEVLQDGAADMRWMHDRLRPQATPEWYAQTQAISYLTPSTSDKHTQYQKVVMTAIDGDNSFFNRREIIDEYGWRHFGELYADHETMGHQGATPLVSHYNNQYDMIYGAMVHYAGSGDIRWFFLMDDLARHVMDIDIYHTCEDRPSYNGGMFWHTDHYVDAATCTHRTYSKATLERKNLQGYGGGPSNEHNYTTGLLHYYFLTGDPAAREAVQGLASWVMNMDDGSQRLLGRFDKRPTGLSSSTVTWDYHGPGRGAGNSINALLDAYGLTGEPRYLTRAEELIRRCIHPQDEIAKRNLQDVEYRWSYTVFLQVLGKYLDVKSEKDEIDYMYSYAQTSLLHYAKWMLDQEVPYKSVLHKVQIPTETWPAQDIRKSNVFKFAAKHADEPLRSLFLRKSEDFFHACLTDLLSFETWMFTRPIVLLTTNGYMQAYFDQHPEMRAPRPSAVYDFGKPQTFVPQFCELYRARQKFITVISTIRTVARQLLSGNRHHGSPPIGEDHG